MSIFFHQDTDDLLNSETGEKRSPRQQRRQFRKELQAFLKSLILLPLIGSASPVFADSFVVDGNKALNTNNSFSKIYGQPRMSVWDFNPNDPDQQFTIDPNSKLPGSRLIHRSTGKCLNAYLPKNGSDVNVWGCSETDPDQRFDIKSVGNGYFQIQRRGTTLCLDNPVPRANGGRVILWECDRSNTNVNQRWKNSSVIVNPPPPPTTNQKFESFVHSFVNTWNIARLDRSDLRGQCVTLIARYLQEVYLTGSDKTRGLALNNGHGTAAAVASQFPQFFEPLTSSGLPKRGAVVSFPDLGPVPNVGCPNNLCGHTGIAMEARTLSSGQRQMRIMDSNWDGKAPTPKNPNSATQVKEEYSYWLNIPKDSRYGNNIRWTNPR
jgi:hypothetical protein